MRISTLIMLAFVICGVSLGGIAEIAINGSCDVSKSEIRRAARVEPSDSGIVDNVLRLLNSCGYPEAVVSLQLGDTEDTLNVIPGVRYRIGSVRVDGELEPACRDLLEEIEFRRMFADSVSIQVIAERMIGVCGDLGYPFAQVSIDSLEIGNGYSVDVKVRVTMGPLAEFDTCLIVGADPRTAKHLASVLPAKPGAVFSESRIDESIRLLKTCSYLRVDDSATLEFSNDNSICTPVFSVRQLPASFFEGLVGYQPGQAGKPGYVKGSVRADFENLLGNGLSFSLRYHKKDQLSHDVSLAARQRFLFGRQVAVGASVRQLKYEDLYQSLQAEGQIEQAASGSATVRLTGGWTRYTPSGSEYRGVFHSRKWTWGLGSTILLSLGSISQSVSLDVAYGLKRQYSFAGVTPDAARVDDTRLLAKYSLNIFAGSGLGGIIALSGAALNTGESDVPPTDLFRLGGARSLRGYHEDQFLCRRYATATIQPELALTSGALVKVFAEGAWFRDSSGDLFREGAGFGFGFSLPTGSLSIDVAWGRDDTFGEGKLYVILESRF
jgi:outer membrane protein assembly factor BamA